MTSVAVAATDPAVTQARLDAIRARLVALAQAARTKHRAEILVSNFAAPAAQAGNLFDASDPDSLVHLVSDCNRQLARDLAPISATALDSLRGGDAAATAATATVAVVALRRADERTPLVPWLLALSLLLLVGEWAARGWLGARAGRADASRAASAVATPAAPRSRGVA